MASSRALFTFHSQWTAENRAVLRVLIPFVVGLSILLTVGYGLQVQLRLAAQREHLQILLRGWDGLGWLVWPLAAPVILVMIRRYPLVRGHIRENLFRLALASVGLCAVLANLQLLLRLVPNLWLPPEDDLRFDFASYAVSAVLSLPTTTLTYTGFFSATLAIDYYFKNRRRTEEALQLKLRTAQLESELAQAELEALRGQLHPHFLFNSFNAVAALVRLRRNEAAVEMIAQLSALLRLALERSGRHELPLAEELDFVRRYLEIERIRFGEKLELQLEFAASELDTLVPNLLLQPLVENAIKHGISRRTIPGRVRVSARRQGDRVVLEVENDGPDAPPAAAATGGRTGIGLMNTRARLDRIYGAGYRLDMLPRADGGMLVRVDLPLRGVPVSTPISA